GVELGKLLQRSRRVGCAIEIPDLLRQVAQLAGFVDQARLFRALRAVTNKLHFLTPFGVSFGIMGVPAPLHGTARGEIQPLTGLRIAATRSGRSPQTMNLKASPSRWMRPALWPGVGISVISSHSLWSLGISSALPASTIGFTESSNTAAFSGSCLWSRQCSYSVLPNT